MWSCLFSGDLKSKNILSTLRKLLAQVDYAKCESERMPVRFDVCQIASANLTSSHDGDQGEEFTTMEVGLYANFNDKNFEICLL